MDRNGLKKGEKRLHKREEHNWRQDAFFASLSEVASLERFEWGEYGTESSAATLAVFTLD